MKPNRPAAAAAAQIESIINPVRGLRDAQQRAGIVPVNHAKANAMAVREASQMNALRKANEEQGGSSKGLKLPPGAYGSDGRGGRGPRARLVDGWGVDSRRGREDGMVQ